MGKTVNAAGTAYVQDVQAGLPVVLAETTGGQTSLYVYGNDLLARVDAAGTPAFYHADGLGSVRGLSDLAGARTDAYTYDAFGALRSQTGGAGQPFTFAGEQADGELGLVFLRARYYDPAVGRFLGKDAVGGSVQHPQTWNFFVYVYNHPTGLVDPVGFWGISAKVSLGAAGGLLGGGEVSGGFGPELEFPSWNPLDWRVGFGTGGTLQANTGLYAELTPKIGGSIYIWDYRTPIPGASDAPITSCAGLSGAVAAGVSGAICTGEGKSGVKVGATIGAEGGVKGFVSAGKGVRKTWSLRDLWNSTVEAYNSLAGGGNPSSEIAFSVVGSSGGGAGGGGGGSWGSPPSKGK